MSITCMGTIVFDNQLTITNNVTINNDSGGAVTFDESSANGDNRFFTVNGGASLTLDGFTLQNGNGLDGGAIFNNGGTVTITNSTLSGNSTTNLGGAIYNNIGTVTINTSTLSNNSTNLGGAIFNNGGTVTITDSTLSGNSASTVGGAIVNTTTGTVTINTSTLSGNSSTAGGAIHNSGTVNSQNTHYAGNATNNTCFGTITDNGGNTRVNSAGCPGTVLVNLAVNPLSCSGNNMVVNITAGDPNFNITGTAGPNLPTNNVGVASHTINGPGSWTGVTVTELTGDAQSSGSLGDITCPPPPPTFTVNTCDFASLQAAVTSANVAGGTVSITCTGTIVFDNQLFISNNVTINNDSLGLVTFDETSLDGDNRFFAVNAGASLTLNGFTLQNGDAGNGGAISNNGGTLTITNCTLSGNSATNQGGAIYNNGGTLTITNSTLSNNFASSLGGAILNTGGTLTINTSTLSGNSASSFGGAIFNTATMTINTSTLLNNSAPVGGAIRNDGGTVNSQNTHYQGDATNNTCSGIITDNGGNTRVNSAGCPGTLLAVNLAVNPLSCSGNNMVVNITAGDPNFNITGTAGPNLPTNNVGIASHTITGPGTWTGVTVTELSGDTQSSGSLGDITCQIPLTANAVCDTNGDLLVNITGGDANFNITSTGGTATTLSASGVGLGITPLTGGTLGVNTWTGVTVSEIGFSSESILLGDFNCNVPLVASAVCNGTNLEVTTTSGDVSFNITDGATNYGLGVGLTTTIITGPVTTANLTVTETGGDGQSTNLGAYNCSSTLTANAVCDVNGGLAVNITSGDPNFNITGTGTGLPLNNVGGGTRTLNDDVLGVNTWTGVTVTELGGDGESILVGTGDFNCNVPLLATAVCNGLNLDVTITSGDVAFNVTDGATPIQLGLSLGLTSIPGPVIATNLTITEVGGDGESFLVGAVNCSNTLNVPVTCDANGDVQINVLSADLPLDVTGTGLGLGLPITINALGVTTLTGNAIGPNTWTNIVFTETTGDTENTSATPITITCNKPADVTAVCVGDALHVTVNSADVSVDLTDGATNIQTGLGFGTLIIPGPINVTALTATETGGDAQSTNLGAYNCFATSTLTATAICNGDDLDITISNGNAPFSISVTDSVGVMNLGSLPLGTHTFTGPDTFSNIGITEDTGDFEAINITSITCPSLIPVVPVVVVLPPDPNALGCELTNTVDMPNATDNTYCRVLMRDGAVVGYSGAIPQSLIDLGVIFAVDVYQLRGGQAVNDFTGYQQICLGGTGRLFYMDSRQSPRSLIELATETIGGMTCGWIPAPGTLILTSR